MTTAIAGTETKRIVDMHESDPGKACDCRNVCSRSSKRGACPCLVRGSFCTDRCTCGTEKQTCSNCPGSRGSKLSKKLGIAMEESIGPIGTIGTIGPISPIGRIGRIWQWAKWSKLTEKPMKLETSPKVTKSKRSLHWCRSISKKHLCRFYYSISQKVITLSGRRFITVLGVLLHYRAVITLSGVFYYIIGQLLQYRAFITLSVGTEADTTGGSWQHLGNDHHHCYEITNSNCHHVTTATTDSH